MSGDVHVPICEGLGVKFPPGYSTPQALYRGVLPEVVIPEIYPSIQTIQTFKG
jgi:hypothetical protein